MSDSLKFDSAKPRLDLVPPALIEAVGIIRTYGIAKYHDPESWKKVVPERYRAAMIRHLCAYLRDPSGVDKESGYPHLWHLACNVAFLVALETPKPQMNKVHCKDCRHLYIKDLCLGTCELHGGIVEPYDSCANGEQEAAHEKDG